MILSVDCARDRVEVEDLFEKAKRFRPDLAWFIHALIESEPYFKTGNMNTISFCRSHGMEIEEFYDCYFELKVLLKSLMN